MSVKKNITKVVVVNKNTNKNIHLSIDEFIGFDFQNIGKFYVYDEATGKAPANLKVKSVGRELVLEWPELDRPLVLTGISPELFQQFNHESSIEKIALSGGSLATPSSAFVANYAAAEQASPNVATDAGSGAATDSNAASQALGTASGTVWLGLGLLAALGAGGGGGSSPIPSVGGLALDGYLSGARVTRVNGSGNTVTTDATGHYTGLTGTGAVKVVGGTDTSTGQAFQGTLTAPDGATVVTPITTLITSLAGSNATAAQVQAATQTVLTKLGIITNGQSNSIDVLNTDPVTAAQSSNAATAVQALATYKAGVIVATALQVISGGDSTQFGAAANALVSTLSSSAAVDPVTHAPLTGAALVVASLSSVAASVNSAVQSVDGGLLGHHEHR
jgi:hypothetical protein